MPILYKAIPKINSLKANKSEVFHAKTIANGAVEFEDFLKKISKKSSVPYIDCLRFFLYFEETLMEELAAGKIVRLNDLGSFQIGATSKSVANIEDVTEDSITKPHINYRAGKGFKKMLQALEFKKVKG